MLLLPYIIKQILDNFEIYQKMLQIFMSSLQHSKSRHDSLKYYNKVSSLTLSAANQQLITSITASMFTSLELDLYTESSKVSGLQGL